MGRAFVAQWPASATAPTRISPVPIAPCWADLNTLPSNCPTPVPTRLFTVLLTSNRPRVLRR